MANVKFQAPNPYSQQAADLNRRQKMAEMLQQQSMEPLQQQSAGGMVIPLNPLAGLAKVLQSYTSSRQLSDLDKKRAGLEAQDIKSAQEMMAQFRNSATEQPIAEGDNTLQELAVRPMAQSAGVKPVVRSQLMKAGLAPGSDDYEAASAPARLNELVSPAVSLAERQQNILPAALGAGVGPYQQKLAQILYEKQPEAPKGTVAPINLKDVDLSKSDLIKFRATGDSKYIVYKPTPVTGSLSDYQKMQLYYAEEARRRANESQILSQRSSAIQGDEAVRQAEEFRIRYGFYPPGYVPKTNAGPPLAPTAGVPTPAAPPALGVPSAQPLIAQPPAEQTPVSRPMGQEERQEYAKKKSELETSIAQIKNYQNVLARVTRAGSLYGKGRGEVDASYAAALAAVRIIQNTGVFNPGEAPLLNRALANAASINSILDPTAREAIQGQIDQQFNGLDSKLAILNKQYGQIDNNSARETGKPTAAERGAALEKRLKGGN